MQFNVDKRFIEILNSQGVEITWKQFRHANDIRRLERESDPVAVAKKEKARKRNELEVSLYRDLLNSIPE